MYSWSTADLYRNAFQALNSYDKTHLCQVPVNRNLNYNYIPVPSRQNLLPVNSPGNSPLRRPREDSDNDNHHIQDFDNAPAVRTVEYHNSKQGKFLNSSKANNYPQNLFNGNSSSSQQKNRFDFVRSSRSPQSKLFQQSQMTVSLNGQCQTISTEAQRFVQTSYGFPPFVIRFATEQIRNQQATEDGLFT
ncbi:unnamed protein product [Didymodactylos carnosus]|uniref:Uncharacterized protein n=1 Tax=Didymodactylos carnosus TaxID=1234261 RepID=A0A815TTQ3_9BILA|nr:unnamed protein product [Didymodactylos carnosus]CAF1507372.1 unnamed protein product [Didymodactylos carnosus]CAF4164139.1 unnamed protein product [Didymodactylos carnosus]CAF4368497.1 unnamed protein product [Didymodactylos carnosus]